MNNKLIEEIARAIERAWSRNHASVRSDPEIAWRVWMPEAEAAYSVMEKRLGELEEAYAAFRYIYEHGSQPAPIRPQWVSDVFNKAYSSVRIARALNNESKPVENGHG